MHLNGNAEDNSGLSNNGNLNGNTNCNIVGKFGQACYFDGLGDYIKTTNDLDFKFDVNKDFSVSAWIKPETYGGWIFANKGINGFYCYVQNNSVYRITCGLKGNNSEVSAVSSTNSVGQLNVWYHVVFTADRDGNAKVYVNGQTTNKFVDISKIGSITGTYLSNSNKNYFSVGAGNYNGGSPFKGTIDELIVFNKVLNQEEINSLYSAGGSSQQCIENWQFESWGDCINGQQSGIYNDINNCGTINNKPVTIQSCVIGGLNETINNTLINNSDGNNVISETNNCIENWDCENWSECINGTIRRNCVEINNCGTQNNIPEIEMTCAVGEVDRQGEDNIANEENILNDLTGNENEIIEGECKYLDIYWGDENGNRIEEVSNGQLVYMIVISEGCEGRDVEYTINEIDLFSKTEEGKDKTVFVNNIARKEYKVKWKDETASFGFKDGDLELEFTAHTNPTGTSTQLRVDAGSTSITNAGLMTTASRTTCVAPCGVFFDATAINPFPSVQRPFHELYYEWDFADPTSGNFATTGKPKNRAVGGVAAHVFENAGTYIVTLDVGNGGTQTFEYTQTIIVQNPDDIYSGANTFCVSNTNNWAGCPTTIAGNRLTDYDVAINTLFSVNGVRRVLFRRGELFNTISSGVHNNFIGPYFIGAYGSGNDPIINMTISGSAISASGNDIIITGLNFTSNYNTVTGYGNQPNVIYMISTTNLLTIHKNSFSGIGLGMYLGQNGGEISNTIISENFATSWQNYALLSGDVVEKFGFIGNSFKQNPLASRGDGKSPTDNYYFIHGSISGESDEVIKMFIRSTNIARTEDDYSIGTQCPSQIPADQWTLITYSIDNSGALLYVNGNLCGSDNYSPRSGILGAQNYIGRPGTNLIHDRDFAGSIDEVRIYNKKLSATEILNLNNSPDGSIASSNLVLHYNFDDLISDGIASDISGLLHHGTCNVGSNCPTFSGGGIRGNTYVFDGEGNQITYPSISEINVNNMTVSVWVKRTSIPRAIPDLADHGPMRLGTAQKVLITENDLFSNTGWSFGGVCGYHPQPNIRLSTGDLDGAIANYSLVSNNILVGGASMAGAGAANEQVPAVIGDFIIERNKFIATECSSNFIGLGLGGSTIRNNLFIEPDFTSPSEGIRSILSYDNHSNIASSNNDFENKIYNNVYYSLNDDLSVGTRFLWVNSPNPLAFGTFVLKNNIMYAPNAVSNGYFILWNAPGTSLESDNNIANPNTFSSYNGNSYSLINWQNLPGQNDSNSSNVNPLLVNPSGGNYHLAGNSPAIDNGTFVAGLYEDYDGNLRPQGSGYDIGAYENISTGGAPVCGDNQCNNGETCLSCSVDCGVCAPVCNDAICSVGENCLADNIGCTDNSCYEPTCTNGCGQTAVANGQTDEACNNGNVCNGNGGCVPVIVQQDNSLIMNLKFDDSITDGNASDSSGNGKNGNCTIGAGGDCPIYSSNTGHDGNGEYNFDGINDKIGYPILNNINVAEMTVSVWVKRTGTPIGTDRYSIVHGSISGDGDEVLRMQIDSSGNMRIEDDFGVLTTCSQQVPINTWTHLVYVINSTLGSVSTNGTALGYLNGNLCTTPDTSFASRSGILGGKTFIGTRPSGNSFVHNFTGGIDDVRIYNRSLTANEVMNLFIGISGGSVCGNGNPETGEQCDDGNQLSGDGCSAICELETSLSCGNGIVEAGEQCDDGNNLDSDGCTYLCQIQSGYICTGEPSVCTTTGFNVYHIGHSLVNGNMPLMFEQLATDAGKIHSFGRHTSTGSGSVSLRDRWNNPFSPGNIVIDGGTTLYGNEIPTGNYNVFVMTEEAPLNDPVATDTTRYALLFHNYSRLYNSSTQVYMYQTWYRWNYTVSQSSDTSVFRGLTALYRANWELVVDQVNANPSRQGAPMLLIPGGNAMIRLTEEAEAGNIPGLTDIGQVFRNDGTGYRIHMNDWGNYFIALVHYATIYRQSPEGLTNTVVNYNGDTVTVPSLIATEMQRIAWEVVSSDPYSGVIGASVVCGNGIVESGEACDDGNTNNGEGCSSICQVESGWWCAYTTPSNCFIQNTGQDCSLTNLGLTNLMDLGTGNYDGYQGGFYPLGSNSRPAQHLTDGLSQTNQIQPLDVNGNPDPINGKIGFISASMSNGVYEFNDQFSWMAATDSTVNSKLVFANTSVGNNDISSWANNNNNVWNTVNQRISSAGLTNPQIQVVWMKQAKANPGLSANPNFPDHAYQLINGTTNNGGYEQILINLKIRFPNIKAVYISSRTRAYNVNQASLNPEPYAYESGFAVKWLIEKQINGGLGFSGSNPQYPWITWGPYLWADGVDARTDGFNWLCSDTRSDDGTHPSVPQGSVKIANEMLNFFKTDDTTRSWFLENPLTTSNQGRIGINLGRTGQFDQQIVFC